MRGSPPVHSDFMPSGKIKSRQSNQKCFRLPISPPALLFMQVRQDSYRNTKALSYGRTRKWCSNETWRTAQNVKNSLSLSLSSFCYCPAFWGLAVWIGLGVIRMNRLNSGKWIKQGRSRRRNRGLKCPAQGHNDLQSTYIRGNVAYFNIVLKVRFLSLFAFHRSVYMLHTAEISCIHNKTSL